jgi:hypothetical protein
MNYNAFEALKCQFDIPFLIDFSSLSSKMRLTSFYKVMGSLCNSEEVFRHNYQGAFNDFKIYPARDGKDLDGKEKA